MHELPEGWQSAVRLYRQSFDGSPSFLAVAPGRVNLIGEHTDYQGGFVFPAAVDLFIFVAAGPSTEDSVLVSDTQSDPHQFAVSSLKPGGAPSWGDYAAGVAWAIQAETGLTLPNLRAAITSTLPIGSGLSSSAAVEMAFGTLWRKLAGLNIEDGTLAALGQVAENRFVGMRCGIMDQTASLFGKKGSALFVDTLRADKPTPVPIPDGLAIVVCDTQVKHELTGTEYNDRRAQSESAAEILGVTTLREVDPEQLERRKGGLTDALYRRARHIITENQRVLDFKSALEASKLSEIGGLMRASHQSLREDYEVSCPELDAMSEAANGATGCIGARMMGGGFGGACIALVEQAQTSSFIELAATAYQTKTGVEGRFTVCKAVDGAWADSLETD